MNTKEKAIAIYRAAVEAVQPKTLLRNYLFADAKTIRIGNLDFDRSKTGRLLVVAAGKAAGAMACEAEKLLGDAITCGLCITKHQHALPLSKLITIEAGHPVPDEESVSAAVHIHQMLEGSKANDIIVLLLSGGASALIADLPVGCTLHELQQLNELLLRSGASIKEVNTVRKHTGTLKGGKLAAISAPAQVVTLALSDVTDDDVSVIGSGLTVPDTTTFAAAVKVLTNYHLWEYVPAAIRQHLLQGINGKITANPVAADACFTSASYFITGNNLMALKAARFTAETMGYHAAIFKAGLTGDVAGTATMLIQQFNDYRGLKPACFILGGEPTLKVEANGKGGRCQHFVLAALHEMSRSGGMDMRNFFTILAAGTDGTDGPTDAAGAVADSNSLTSSDGRLLSSKKYLQQFDSYHFFEKIGGHVKTGATQTNVGDVILLFVE